jgi:hypothetical protein
LRLWREKAIALPPAFAAMIDLLLQFGHQEVSREQRASPISPTM